MITLNIDVTMLGPIALILGIVVGLGLCFLSFFDEERRKGLYLLGTCAILSGRPERYKSYGRRLC